MMNLLGAIFSGLLIGALARYFYPGAVPMGWGMTILLGVGGSLLAGLFTASRSPGGASWPTRPTSRISSARPPMRRASR